MSKLFTESGLLTEAGRNTFQTVQSSLEGTIASVCKDMSEGEILTVQAALAKMVADTMSATLQAKRELKHKLDTMTDIQLEIYLKSKYGDNWMFQTLEQVDLDRCPKLQQDKIENILKESAKHISQIHHNGVRLK